MVPPSKRGPGVLGWKFPVVAYINVAYNLATMKMNGAVPVNDCTSIE